MTAYDPVAVHEARRIYQGHARIQFSDSHLSACSGADALVIVTEWKEFRSPDFALMKASMNAPIIFDGRNIYDPAAMRRMEFDYHPIGRNL